MRSGTVVNLLRSSAGYVGLSNLFKHPGDIQDTFPKAVDIRKAYIVYAYDEFPIVRSSAFNFSEYRFLENREFCAPILFDALAGNSEAPSLYEKNRTLGYHHLPEWVSSYTERMIVETYKRLDLKDFVELPKKLRLDVFSFNTSDFRGKKVFSSFKPQLLVSMALCRELISDLKVHYKAYGTPKIPRHEAEKKFAKSWTDIKFDTEFSPVSLDPWGRPAIDTLEKVGKLLTAANIVEDVLNMALGPLAAIIPEKKRIEITKKHINNPWNLRNEGIIKFAPLLARVISQVGEESEDGKKAIRDYLHGFPPKFPVVKPQVEIAVKPKKDLEDLKMPAVDFMALAKESFISTLTQVLNKRFGESSDYSALVRRLHNWQTKGGANIETLVNFAKESETIDDFISAATNHVRSLSERIKRSSIVKSESEEKAPEPVVQTNDIEQPLSIVYEPKFESSIKNLDQESKDIIENRLELAAHGVYGKHRNLKAGIIELIIKHPKLTFRIYCRKFPAVGQLVVISGSTKNSKVSISEQQEEIYEAIKRSKQLDVEFAKNEKPKIKN